MVAGESGRVAEVLLSACTRAAVSASVAKPRDADAPAELQGSFALRNRKRLGLLRRRKRRTEFLDRPDDLMPGDDRHFLLRQIPFDHVQIGAANGATADADPHLARPRLGQRQIDGFQRRGADRSDATQEHGLHGTRQPPSLAASELCDIISVAPRGRAAPFGGCGNEVTIDRPFFVGGLSAVDCRLFRPIPIQLLALPRLPN